MKSNITQWRDKILAANPFTEPATESSSSQATMRKISLLCGFIIGTILYGFRKMLARRHNQNHEYTKTNRCTYCSCQPDRRLYGKAISPLITTTSLSRKTVCSNTIGQPARCGCHSSRATPGDGMRDVVQGYTPLPDPQSPEDNEEISAPSGRTVWIAARRGQYMPGSCQPHHS